MNTYSKMASGQWGVRVYSDEAPVVGAVVKVTKRSGEEKQETIASVMTAGNGVHVCTIVATPRASSSRGRSGYRRGYASRPRGRCEDAPCCGCCGGAESYYGGSSDY